jgi:hypothetical protein
VPSATAPVVSPFGTPIISPSRSPIISPLGIPVSHTHPSTWPIAVVTQPRPHGKTDPKTYHRLKIRRIRLDIYDLGVVLRHIDHVGFGRNHTNAALLFDDPLLRGIDQRARCSGLGAQRLNRVHHVGRSIQKHFSELSRPLEILIHPFDNLGIAGQRLNALVPWLVVDLSYISACGKKTCREDDIGWNCRCWQNRCDQSVRIERNRTK